MECPCDFVSGIKMNRSGPGGETGHKWSQILPDTVSVEGYCILKEQELYMYSNKQVVPGKPNT